MENSIEKIPIRATILSALSVVPYLIVLAAIFTSDLTYAQRGNGIHLILSILCALRFNFNFESFYMFFVLNYDLVTYINIFIH
jgi:hypothetical protein